MRGISPTTFAASAGTYAWGSVYGGRFVAQACEAAWRTVPSKWRLSSIKLNYLRAGDTDTDLHYSVDILHDGRTSATRSVVVSQQDSRCVSATVSFGASTDSSGRFQSARMPEGVPSPDEADPETWNDVFEKRALPAGAGDGVARIWFRAGGPAAPTVHPETLLCYVSDDLPAHAAANLTGVPPLEGGPRGWDWLPPGVRTLSLDHAVWVYDAFDPASWHLFDCRAEVLDRSRSIVLGRVFTTSGILIAAVAQEVSVRLTAPRG